MLKAINSWISSQLSNLQTPKLVTSHLSLVTSLLIFNFSFLILTCGLDIEDPTPPSPPVWVQKSLPVEWPERGIDAHESGGIYLEWYSRLNSDIEEFNLYRAELDPFTGLLSPYNQVIVMSMGDIVSQNGQFIDTDVIFETTYSYYMTATDHSGNVSNSSDSISYSLLPSIEFGSLRPNDTLNYENKLSWKYHVSLAMEDYVLTILDEYNTLILRSHFAPTNYLGNREYFYLPESLGLSNGRPYYWRIDANANYRQNMETRGSESRWATFIFHP